MFFETVLASGSAPDKSPLWLSAQQPRLRGSEDSVALIFALYLEGTLDENLVERESQTIDG